MCLVSLLIKPHAKLCVCRGRGKNALCRVKKGGGGGKYTWGALMSTGMERTASPVLDRNDPNYESDAESGLLRTPSMQSQPLKRYKEAVRRLFPTPPLSTQLHVCHQHNLTVQPASCSAESV